MNRINLNTIIYIFLTPIITFFVWLAGAHSWINFINIFFTVSIIMIIMLFMLLLVQEGIFDVTSYGFRKFRYQLMRKKNREMYEEDEFYNPKTPKRDSYFVQPWIKPALLINVIYLIISFIFAFIAA